MMVGYAMSGLGYFTMTLFWVVLICSTAYLARRVDWARPTRKEEYQALTIVPERYAKGELNKEECA